MPNLEVLDLPLPCRSRMRGIEAIAEHPKLLPSAAGSAGHGRGLNAFARMPKLRWLHLMEVPLTDAGLLVFQEMPRLESPIWMRPERPMKVSRISCWPPGLHFSSDQVHIPSDPRKQDGHTD